LSDKGGDFAEDAASNLDRLRNKTLSEVLCARLGTRLTKYGIHSNHFTAKFVRNNMERAVTIMKLHKLHKSERSLISAKDSESFFVPDMDCGEPFVHEEVNSNSRFQNIGAYLMKDSERGFMIRAGSTTTSFAKRLVEHFNCRCRQKIQTLFFISQ
jgi:hypothetical protein